MGRKKDDVESLVDEKNEDQSEVSKDSSSRRRRRDKPKKLKDGAEKNSNDKDETDNRATKEVKKVTGDDDDLDATIQKKRARDKRRTKERANTKENKEKYRGNWKRDVNRPSTTVNIQKSRKFIKGVKGSVS